MGENQLELKTDRQALTNSGPGPLKNKPARSGREFQRAGKQTVKAKKWARENWGKEAPELRLERME